MKLINKSRGTGKTMQLIYASAVTGFRIITPNAHMVEHIEKMAKDMGLKIPKPMSDVEYRNRKGFRDDNKLILIDEVQDHILDEALELYFGSPVVAATMTVPIDDDCVPPTPKPLVWDHSTNKVRPIGTAEVQEDGSVKIKLKTNRDVLHETFGHIQFTLDERFYHLEDRLTIRTEDGEDMKFTDWLDQKYVEPKEKEHAGQ